MPSRDIFATCAALQQWSIDCFKIMCKMSHFDELTFILNEDAVVSSAAVTLHAT